jgi:hypothetical protein
MIQYDESEVKNKQIHCIHHGIPHWVCAVVVVVDVVVVVNNENHMFIWF